MRYTVRNISLGRVVLPNPIVRTLESGNITIFDASPGLLDIPSGSKSNRWQEMIDSHLISVQITPSSDQETEAEAVAEAAVAAGGSASVRFLGASSPQYIYVHPTSGSDTVGDGLTSGTAYSTIQRAIDDIPNDFTVDVVIQLAAGSFAGQSFAVTVAPAYRTGSTPSRIYIIGDQTAAYTYATTGTGALVSGKASQVAYTLNHGLTITDGSHWVSADPLSFPLTTRVLRASSTTQMVAVQSSTAARTNEKICAYNTVFTSEVNCYSILPPGGSPFVFFVGVKLAAGGSLTGMNFLAAHVSGCTLYSCIVFTAVFVGCTFVDYGERSSTAFNSLFLDGCLIEGARGSTQQCVFANTNGGPALSIGSHDPLPANPGSGIRQGQSLDFESTGVGINISGNGSYFITTSGSITFAVGRTLDAHQGAMLATGTATSTWSGTTLLPARLRTRASFNKASITYSVVNSANAGQDFDVGAAAAIVTAASNVTDATDLAMLR